MKKKIGIILFISLFFTSLATALDDDILKDTARPESVEELSSKIESSFPAVSHEDANELAEVIQLMRDLEREIFLTNEILGLREEKQEVAEEIVERPTPPAPEEIIVAKQVSEEPEKSLPREEKSLIRFAPAYATFTPRPEVQIYQKEELEKGQLSVVIEQEQTILVPAVGLKRFMVTDTKTLQAAREDGKVSITAISLGRTFLHVWDSEGRRTIKVKVIQKGYEVFLRARRRAVEATKLDSFKVRYSFDRYRLNSSSVQPARSYHYTEWFHRLGIRGETPWGMTSSRFQYEGREFGGGTELQRDLTAWDYSLYGKDVEIYLGDTGAYFSDITLPATTYQGFRFRNADDMNINYDIVWGARGSRMWGEKVLDWPDENYFYGVRGQVEPADFIYFNTTMLQALEDAEDIGEYIYAGGMGLNFLDEAIRIEGEIARGKSEETDAHNHAYKLDAIVELTDYNFIFTGTYKDIDPDFLLVTGTNVPDIGKLGYYLDVDYQPFKQLRLTGEYDVFRNRFSFNPTDTQKYNYDWRGTLDLDITKKTNFRYVNWQRIREGEASPVRGHGQLYDISHTLELPPPLRIASFYLRYEPSQYRNLTGTSSSYTEKKYAAGMNMNVIKNLSYDLSHRWHHRKMLDSGDIGTVKMLSTGLRYSSQILDTPFYGSLNLRYQKEGDVMQNLPLTVGESTVTGGAELKYRPSYDFETYLRVNYKHIRGVLDHDQNREETRIYGGGTYLFDTTLRWGVGGSVRGFVFKDTNGNGQKDPQEQGLSGINIYAGEYLSKSTDSEGKFEFPRLKGDEVSVMFDTKMLPEGYRPTTPNPQIVRLERDFVSEAYFGVLAVGEISGRVFNDLNMNEVFEENDEGVKDVLLALDDGTLVQTMASGHYRMEDVKGGAKTLTMDATTIPPHLIPLAKVKRSMEVKEGEYYQEDFPLYALRTVVGAVFMDKNRNNRFDAGEKGITDVQVNIEDNVALTDNMGRFFLKKLKAGKQKIELDVESLPPGYEIVGDPFKEIDLLPRGEIKEDVDFPVRSH